LFNFNRKFSTKWYRAHLAVIDNNRKLQMLDLRLRFSSTGLILLFRDGLQAKDDLSLSLTIGSDANDDDNVIKMCLEYNEIFKIVYPCLHDDPIFKMIPSATHHQLVSIYVQGRRAEEETCETKTCKRCRSFSQLYFIILDVIRMVILVLCRF
jgi:hypothetical protein